MAATDASQAVPAGGGSFDPRRYAWPVGAIALGVLAPYIQPIIGDAWFPLTTMVYCVVYVMFALGLNVVVGYAGLLDLGYVAFFLFGAYTSAWLSSDFFQQVNWHLFNGSKAKGLTLPIPGIHLNFWFVLIAAACVAALAGVIIGAPTLRLQSDYLALVTLGFGEILPQAFRNAGSIKGFNLSNGTKGIGPIDNINTTPFSQITGGLIPEKVGVFDYHSRYYIILALAVLFGVASLHLRDGKLGRAWLAIREDELAASLMSVPLMRTKLWAYAVGAAAGGFAGAFFGFSLNAVNIDSFNFQFSILILCMVIVGGMGNVYGVALGAIALCWLNYTGLTQIGAEINSAFGTSYNIPRYENLILGVILVLMMLFRRDGFLPAARQKQVRQMEAALEKVGTEEHAAATESAAAGAGGSA
jgi:branched-chain amino acid transport system permease protein